GQGLPDLPARRLGRGPAAPGLHHGEVNPVLSAAHPEPVVNDGRVSVVAFRSAKGDNWQSETPHLRPFRGIMALSLHWRYLKPTAHVEPQVLMKRVQQQSAWRREVLMAHMKGVEPAEAGWFTRLVYWFVRRKFRKLTGKDRLIEPVKVAAHHPRLL